jgi:phosphoketolase
VLPILHLNGYKIANPTVLARISREELDQLLRGYGYTPHYVEGDEPENMHRLMAAALDRVFDTSKRFKATQGAAMAASSGRTGRWSSFAARKDGLALMKSTVSASKAIGAHIRCRWERCTAIPST